MDFSNATILCLGDVMLDRFAYCETERISPEAPVPVLLLQRTQSMLGGAGNVARNVAALGGTAVLMGLLGPDPAGAEIRSLVAANPGLVDGHVASARRPTICKTRYLAGHQQIVRIDEESVHPLEHAEEAALVAAAEHTISDVNAVILSDYAKGVLGPEVVGAAIARARAVYDVSGAGDTVMAVLALASASGHTLPQAMRLANTAAGIVIGKLGTATVELDELMLELARDVRDREWHHAKYYSTSEAETLVRR